MSHSCQLSGDEQGHGNDGNDSDLSDITDMKIYFFKCRKSDTD